MKPSNFTAFREAERRFKVRAEGPLDLAEVIDLQGLSKETADPRVRRIRQVACAGSLRSDRELWLWEVLDGVGGGFCFIPGALDEAQQKYWIERALCAYLGPPNATNLDAHYQVPPEGLWHHYERLVVADGAERLPLIRIPHPDDGAASRAQPPVLSLGRDEMRALLRRIRWATLGFQYDWTSKEYDFGHSPAPFPPDLALWSAQVCRAAGFGENFRAEAGIVNFYQPGDTLTGHVDRSERNMDVPLISLSLGASCIFLLGGPSREDPVTPILLRPGDVIFMTGSSRHFFHGVPRILPGLSPRLSFDKEHGDPPALEMALEVLGDARININARQVNT